MNPLEKSFMNQELQNIISQLTIAERNILWDCIRKYKYSSNCFALAIDEAKKRIKKLRFSQKLQAAKTAGA